jgi:glutathione S-transferase
MFQTIGLDDIDHVRKKQAINPQKNPMEDHAMADIYRIIGAEMSPYSVKVRSYFRYKAIPHQWVLRNAAIQAEYEKLAKMPIIPLVITPEGTGIQDSTPIIDNIEKLHPEPSIHPADPVVRFISALIEEFGDEWGNKWMFHYRWARDVDQISSAGRIARMRGPDASEEKHDAFAAQVRARMVDRVWFVGSNAVTAPQIEAGFIEMLGLLDAHLATRPYLFGGRPGFGDFGLWGRSMRCGPIRPPAP